MDPKLQMMMNVLGLGQDMGTQLNAFQSEADREKRNRGVEWKRERRKDPKAKLSNPLTRGAALPPVQGPAPIDSVLALIIDQLMRRSDAATVQR